MITCNTDKVCVDAFLMNAKQIKCKLFRLYYYRLITKERKSVSTYNDHIGMKCKATKSRRTLKILITIDKKGKEKKVNMQIDAIMCVMPVVSDQRPRFQVNKYC